MQWSTQSHLPEALLRMRCSRISARKGDHKSSGAWNSFRAAKFRRPGAAWKHRGPGRCGTTELKTSRGNRNIARTPSTGGPPWLCPSVTLFPCVIPVLLCLPDSPASACFLFGPQPSFSFAPVTQWWPASSLGAHRAWSCFPLAICPPALWCSDCCSFLRTVFSNPAYK